MSHRLARIWTCDHDGCDAEYVSPFEPDQEISPPGWMRHDDEAYCPEHRDEHEA